MQVGYFSLKHSETFCITRLSTTNHRKVINAQTGPVFIGPPCILLACYISVFMTMRDHIWTNLILEGIFLYTL